MDHWMEASSRRQHCTATSPSLCLLASTPATRPGTIQRRELDGGGGWGPLPPDLHPELSKLHAFQISSSQARGSSINGATQRRALFLLRGREQDLPAGTAAFHGRQLRQQDRRRLFIPGGEAIRPSHDLQRGETQGRVRRRRDVGEEGLPEGVHPHPLRLHRQPHSRRHRLHHQRAASELAVHDAEGRRGRRVEGDDRRGDDSPRALLRQWRQPPAGARCRLQILRLLQRAAAGSQGGGSWRRGIVCRAAGAHGSQGVGALPL